MLKIHQNPPHQLISTSKRQENTYFNLLGKLHCHTTEAQCKHYSLKCIDKILCPTKPNFLCSYLNIGNCNRRIRRNFHVTSCSSKNAIFGINNPANVSVWLSQGKKNLRGTQTVNFVVSVCIALPQGWDVFGIDSENSLA